MANNRNIIKIVHISKERIRLKYKILPTQTPDLDSIVQIEGVIEVTYIKLIGTLVILFKPKIIKAKELLNKIQKKLSNFEFVEELIRTKGFTEDEFNSLSKFIFGGVNRINKLVLRGLRGRADLTSLLPTFLLISSIVVLIRRPQIPHWFLLLRASGDTFTQWIGDLPNESKKKMKATKKGGNKL